MPYYEFKLDGKFVIEAENEQKAKNKILNSSNGYRKFWGEKEPYKYQCQNCGEEFETFVRNKEYCSFECFLHKRHDKPQDYCDNCKDKR